MADVWSHGEAYERFMGRWSRLLAPQFLHWLRAPAGLRWADVGCGSGALTTAILDLCSPARLTAVDPSQAQVAEAARQIHDPRVSFGVGTASNLPARSFDAVVSGLVLNFVDDPDAAVSAMARAAPGGVVATYVWDYAEGMQMLRTFWDVACELDPERGRPATRATGSRSLPRILPSCGGSQDWKTCTPGRSSSRQSSRTSTTSGHRSSVVRVRRPGTSRRWATRLAKRSAPPWRRGCLSHRTARSR